MIVARGVSRRYGAHVALHATDFELGAGELVALVGPNGAGKSTLLSILAGALPPSTGSVKRRAGVGWAPQRPAVYGKLTPRENLALFARLAGAEQVTDCYLPERPAADLSEGQRQRLNLALAYLGDPPCLLLDEPAAALDEAARDELWSRLGLAVERGGAVAFATQSPREAARATRVVTLEEGRLA